MSKHDHPEPKPPCEHPALKHCPKCDAVECKACGKEWKSEDGLAWRENLKRLMEKRPERWPDPAPQWIPSPTTTPIPAWRPFDVWCSHTTDAS